MLFILVMISFKTVKVVLKLNGLLWDYGMLNQLQKPPRNCASQHDKGRVDLTKSKRKHPAENGNHDGSPVCNCFPAEYYANRQNNSNRSRIDSIQES